LASPQAAEVEKVAGPFNQETQRSECQLRFSALPSYPSVHLSGRLFKGVPGSASLALLTVSENRPAYGATAPGRY
jgi:hypothetical protein